MRNDHNENIEESIRSTLYSKIHTGYLKFFEYFLELQLLIQPAKFIILIHFSLKSFNQIILI